MFKITPIQEKSTQIDLCQHFGIEPIDDAFTYFMFDIESGEPMGLTQFEIGEVGYIYNICEAQGRNDFEAMFILTRQTMNFIDKCGAHICGAASDSAPDTLLCAVGFKKIDGEYICDMSGMFDGNCGHH